MKIIHLGTDVKCVFAVVNDEGDIVTQHPFSVHVSDLYKESYDKALLKFIDVRNKLKEQYELSKTIPAVKPIEVSLDGVVDEKKKAKKINNGTSK